MNGSVAINARIDGLYIVGYSLNTSGFHSMNELLRVVPLDASEGEVGQAVLDVLSASTVTQLIPIPPDPSPHLVTLLARAGVRTYAEYARGVREVTVAKYQGLGQNLLNPRGPLLVTPCDNQGMKGGFAGMPEVAVEIEVQDASAARLGQAVMTALALARAGKGRLARPRDPVGAHDRPVAMTSGRVEITARDDRIYVASASLRGGIHTVESHVILRRATVAHDLGEAVISALAASDHGDTLPDGFPQPPGDVEFLAATGFDTYQAFADEARRVTVSHEFWDTRRPLIIMPWRNRRDLPDEGFVELSGKEVVIKVADATPAVVGEAVAHALTVAR